MQVARKNYVNVYALFLSNHIDFLNISKLKRILYCYMFLKNILYICGIFMFFVKRMIYCM